MKVFKVSVKNQDLIIDKLRPSTMFEEEEEETNNQINKIDPNIIMSEPNLSKLNNQLPSDTEQNRLNKATEEDLHLLSKHFSIKLKPKGVKLLHWILMHPIPKFHVSKTGTISSNETPLPAIHIVDALEHLLASRFVKEGEIMILNVFQNAPNKLKSLIPANKRKLSPGLYEPKVLTPKVVAKNPKIIKPKVKTITRNPLDGKFGEPNLNSKYQNLDNNNKKI